MNYTQAIDYLTNQLPMFQRVGAAAYKANLHNIMQLCNLLGNPQKDLQCIHVAGTNGKGSVTHIVASVLIHAGYTVGIYTSPHYLTFRERIKIGNAFIEEDFITDFVSKHLLLFKKVDASFFEITTAMMFEYFKQKKVDYCIIETGLGGRLDSTNIIEPLLSVITNISFDHQQFLGNTLIQIATEKAGIIKKNTPVVVGERQPETEMVFMQKAKEQNATIYFSHEINNATSFEEQSISGTYLHTGGIPYTYQTDLSGAYQQKNIQTALAALVVLQKHGIEISHKAFQNGLKNVCATTYFIGRWMQVKNNPKVILDSAHNEAGIRNLLAQLAQNHFTQLHFVFGTVADKDTAPVLSQLPLNATYYFCKPNVPRGKNEMELSEAAQAFKLKGSHFTNAKAALDEALKNAAPTDLIIVTGSIFLVADILNSFPFLTEKE